MVDFVKDGGRPVPLKQQNPLGHTANRMPHLIGSPGPIHSLEILRNLTVAIVGLGSVGRTIALHLIRLGISLVLIDHGKIKAESLITHTAFVADLGQSKAANIGRLCKELRPDATVRVLDASLETLDVAPFLNCDLVVLATDNLQAEVVAGQRCRRLAIPLLQASLHGETMVVQIRFFSNSPGSPCPVCGFSRDEWSALNRQVRYSCEGGDVLKNVSRIEGSATRSMSFICSLAAELAMVQFLRYFLQLGVPVGDTLLEYCGYTHRTSINRLQFHPACPIDHTVYRRRTMADPIGSITLREMVEAAGFGGDGTFNGVSIRIGGHVYAETIVCACTRFERYKKFIPTAKRRGPCPRCGKPRLLHPFFVHDPISIAKIPDQLDTPLHRLGVKDTGWSMVRNDQDGVLLRYSTKKG